MKPDWITRAIGRHLIDLPVDAKLYETYTINKVKIEPFSVPYRFDFDFIVDERERALKKARDEKHGSSFIERVEHPNGSATLISWKGPYSDGFLFDTYFLIGSKALKYSGGVSAERRDTALALRYELAGEWRELTPGEIPTGVGFVVGDVMLVDKDFNLEEWYLSAKFPGKPAVIFKMDAFARYQTEPGLRARVGGGLASSALSFLAGALSGKSTLRNHARPVGPIEADEILMAATQSNRRCYSFTWETPGKPHSLAEPNLIAELVDGIYDPAAAGPQSFADDDEALALWDEIIDSIRLRPGAAG